MGREPRPPHHPEPPPGTRRPPRAGSGGGGGFGAWAGVRLGLGEVVQLVHGLLEAPLGVGAYVSAAAAAAAAAGGHLGGA